MNLMTLLTRLGLATLVFSVLAAMLMLVRRRLRARFGAEAMYMLWLLLPLGVALCCWPVHRQFVQMQPAVVPALSTATSPSLAALPSSGPHYAAIALCFWLVGAAANALLLCRRQRQFTRSLGALERAEGDTWMSARSDIGPMLVGLLRPRIVLPASFDCRYSVQERAAVLAHERMHRQRGDLWWNMLGAALRCLFWFHPLGRAAQRCYLADQELACDSAVLRSGSHAPKAYANALLKTQTSVSLPLGCAMQATSPIRERILNLDRRSPGRRVRVSIALVLALATVSGGRLAWAASREVIVVDAVAASDAVRTQAPYGVNMTIAIHGEQTSPRLLVRAGEPFAVAGEHGGTSWRVEFTLDRIGDGMVRLAGKITEDGKIIAAPVLVAPLGERVSVQIGNDVRVALVVQETRS